MKYKLLTIGIAGIIMSCASGGSNASKTTAVTNVADNYGYSKENAIMVGDYPEKGFRSGPANERAYLNRLTGLNGEKVTYVRKGSCCGYENKDLPMGMGMLDIYEVTIRGEGTKRTLYLNMYEKGKQYAPKGFLLKR